MSRLLDVRSLDAGYGALRVVRDLSLHVEEGEIVALLGPNGSGKTTALLTVSGLLPPLAGDLEVFGIPAGRRSPQAMARQGLAHVPEGRSLFYGLTAKENVELAAGRDRRAVARALGTSRTWPAISAGGPGCSRVGSSRCWRWRGLWPRRPACSWSTR